ncbi:hypothetical protein GCM10010912_63510 [Paenibacillus albidus]|uniref:N-acetyltransferase domain-containing protein n=1 Tax=Paenibacillus albidus TaxID=2041023 RepID=A0A917D5G8_9BACL|nr:GNAT family N-acetyltransferase [Paenibacillus albidus]GGG10409.1 hypothetical protein GCM10010912_63510 [Paenibacillus albidus]
MRADVLAPDQKEDFLAFCRKHRAKLDDSFLDDEALRAFELSAENPTWIIPDLQGGIAAAASLMLNDYSRRGRKARFRIFHAEPEDTALYQSLLEAMVRQTRDLDQLNLFVPQRNQTAMKVMTDIGFTVERYSYVLVREGLPVPDFSLPEGVEIRAFRRGADEEAWCTVRNTGFAQLKGNETPATPDMLVKLISGPDYIEGGLMMLYFQGEPVGIVRGSADEYDQAPIMNIGPLAILPEYQGLGFGKILLRAVLRFARENSYKKTILCVNAENERAQGLYLGEGFKQVEAAVCYVYNLSS